MSDNNQQVGRLALRVEGAWWVAYYSDIDSMDRAVELGRVRMSIVRNDVCKMSFMSLMQTAVSDMIEDITGTSPSWPDGPVAAPEHERAGRS